MNDEKQILIFSKAGGTGCSYHAERSALKERLRVHYLLEARWRADTVVAGIYNKGLETIAADSMQIVERRFAYIDPARGAQSYISTIEKKHRNRPMTLADVQALTRRAQRATLMINGKSGRPAVMVPTRSIMRDDGSIRPGVVLIRPMDEPRYEVRQFEETNWDEADKTAFDAAWAADIGKVAAFSTATLHVVTGLLLSIWRLLPQDYCRVYRLQSDDGERIVGRVVAPSELSRLCRSLGTDRVETITSDHAWRLPTDGSFIVGLAGNMTLRRVRVMNDHRLERTGFTDGMREWLTVIGLFSGIIAWKTRFFVPMMGEGQAILSRLMDGHRLVDVVSRY